MSYFEEMKRKAKAAAMGAAAGASGADPNKLTTAELASGMESKNIIVNMATYIFIGGGIILFVVFLKFGAVLRGKMFDKLKEFMNKKYAAIKKKFMFNGQIKA